VKQIRADRRDHERRDREAAERLAKLIGGCSSTLEATEMEMGEEDRLKMQNATRLLWRRDRSGGGVAYKNAEGAGRQIQRKDRWEPTS
jgi:hypothetical protein